MCDDAVWMVMRMISADMLTRNPGLVSNPCLICSVFCRCLIGVLSVTLCSRRFCTIQTVMQEVRCVLKGCAEKVIVI